MTKTANILVPVDFSDCSREVVREAARMAKNFGAHITLVHIDELPEGVTADTPVAEGDRTTSVRDFLRAASEQRLKRLGGIAEAEGVVVRHQLGLGRVADGLLRAIRETAADMVVMGTHGRTGVSRLVLGSVAESLLRHAPCPVTTVRTLHKPECEARSCAWCSTDITTEIRRVAAESMG